MSNLTRILAVDTQLNPLSSLGVPLSSPPDDDVSVLDRFKGAFRQHLTSAPNLTSSPTNNFVAARKPELMLTQPTTVPYWKI